MCSIMPGDKSDVTLEVLVDKQTTSQLNSGAVKLYDIFVPYLHGGKDVFIIVTGSREKSYFGSSSMFWFTTISLSRR